MIQGKEVPANAAEEFLKGVDQDPKFMRFHERMTCVASINQVVAEKNQALAELKDERRTLSVPDPRVFGLALLLALPLLALSAALPWWQARTGLILVVFFGLIRDEVRARQERHTREARIAEITEGLGEVEQGATAAMKNLEFRIDEIDREAASSIRIIDPATFGAPKTEARSS
jgi:hypothetical protein